MRVSFAGNRGAATKTRAPVTDRAADSRDSAF